MNIYKVVKLFFFLDLETNPITSHENGGVSPAFFFGTKETSYEVTWEGIRGNMVW